MKKFNEVINQKNNYYAGNQKLYNEIYNLIDETLNVEIDGIKSDKTSLLGKEKLVEDVAKIVENEVNKLQITLLEEYKIKPNIFKIFNRMKKDIQEDYTKILDTIKSCTTAKQLDNCENMIENFVKKWDKNGDNISNLQWDALDVPKREKEFRNFLKNSYAKIA